MAGRKNSSSLWHHFEKNSVTGKAVCNICQDSISFKSTTANLKSHLKRKHVLTYSLMAPSEEPISKVKKHDHQLISISKVAPDTSAGSSSAASSATKILTPQPKNKRGQGVMDCTASKKMSDEQKKQIDSSATKMLTPQPQNKRRQDMMDCSVSKKIIDEQNKQIDSDLLDLFIDGFHSFSLVDERAFKKFVRWIPGYKLPTRKTISNSLLDELYLKTLQNIREQLDGEVQNICITCDLWTSRANESYIAVTGHYLNKDIELKTVLLGCHQFEGKLTADNIATEMKGILDEWNLGNKVNFAVSDNATNIGKAIRDILGYQHFGCFAHTLNLVVNDALAPLKVSVDKAKRIVQHFRKSTVSSEKLLEYQVAQGKPPKKLIQQVDTCWNSTFFMLSRFVELEEAVRSTLDFVKSNLPVISNEEWIAFSFLCQILKPFENVTSLMSGEKYFMGSLVIVTTRCLKESCNKMLTKNDLPPIIKDVVTALKLGLENRFKNIEQNSTFAICTFLDPRFKIQAFSDQNVGKKTKEMIVELVTSTNKKSFTSEESAETNSTTVEEEDNLWTILDDLVGTCMAHATPLSKAIKEVDMYLADEILPRKNKNGEWNCPLQWWRNHRQVYPKLAELYMQKCNIVATSIPCERMLSKTGNIIADRRTRLTTKKVEKLMFLNVNLSDERFKNYM